MKHLKHKKITILSGGSAIKDIIFELLHYADNISRVVPTTDNGSSSKELRRIFDILSVGDIRQSIAISIPHTPKGKQLVKLINWRFPVKTDIGIEKLKAMMEDRESIIHTLNQNGVEQQQLFRYLTSFYDSAKDSNINLSGGSMGNFILVGAYFMHHQNWNLAIDALERLLGCKAKTFPIYTQNNLHLKATMRDSSIIFGEDKIGREYSSNEECHIKQIDICSKNGDISPIDKIEANSKVVQSIQKADLILYSPGSFFTSILPHLLNLQVPHALKKNQNAKKVFLVNLSQDNETKGCSAKNILEHLFETVQKHHSDITPKDLITDIIIAKHYNQVSFLNEHKEVKKYIDSGGLEKFHSLGINVIFSDLEDPWRRGKFDAEAVVKLLSKLMK